MKESDSRTGSLIENNIDDRTNNSVINTVINTGGELGKVYNRFNDITSRLLFLIDCNKKYTALEALGRKIPKDEYNEYQTILADFKERYINNGSKEVRKSIFETLGRLRAENDYKYYNEYNRQLKKFNSRDEKRADKAKWVVAQTGLNIDSNAIYTIYNDLLDTDYYDNQAEAKKRLDSKKINQSTTMAEFLGMCGFDKDGIALYLDKYGIKADSKVLKRHKDNEELLNTFIENETEAWVFNELAGYYKDRNVSLDTMKKIVKTGADRTYYEKDNIKEYTDDTNNESEISTINRRKLDDAYYRIDKVDSAYKNGKRMDNTSIDDYTGQMDKIYAGLSTIEDKLGFIVDLYAVNYAQIKLNGVAGVTSTYFDNLRKKFFAEYITGGTPDKLDKALKELERLSVNNTVKMMYEDKRFQAEYKDDDKALEKSRLLIKSVMPGFVSAGIFDIQRNITYEMSLINGGELNPVATKILERYNVSEDMTLEEYSKVTGQDINQMMEKYGKNSLGPDSKAYLMFTDNLAVADENIVIREEDRIENAVEQLKINFVASYVTKKQKRYNDEAKQNIGLNEPDNILYEEVSRQVNREPKFKGIEEWSKGEGARRKEQIELNASRQIINDFNSKYNSKVVSYEQYVRLHTGYDVCTSEASHKAEYLAKAIAANALNKRNAAFSLDKIRNMAVNIKKRPEFAKVIKDNDILTDALTDMESIDQITVKMFGEPYKVNENSISNYVNEMRKLSINMMPKEGRSREYKALYDAVKSIGDMKGNYDLNIQGDREAMGELLKGLNMNLMSAVETYISGKEKVRTYKGGRERFDNAMDSIAIMHQFVPGMKKTVENVVGNINRIREVGKNSSKYISIMQYGAIRAEHAQKVRTEKKMPTKQTNKKK